MKDRSEKLRRIANFLIVHTCFFNNIGLYHGKMGIAIFMAHYARFVDNTLYEDFCGILLDEIYKEINNWNSIDFENGILGIAWGIDYLLQNQFVLGDSFDILKEIDEKISEYNWSKVKNNSLENGVAGVFCYLHQHLNQRIVNVTNPFFDQAFVDELNRKCTIQMENINNFTLLSIIRNSDFEISSDISKWRLGLNRGCAGYGLKLIFE